MKRHLFFVCPTDYLETVINKHFHQENYFITSLGNSISFNSQVIEEINTLVEAKSIAEISFVLSDNNKIIMDALKSENFDSFKGLESFYDRISAQTKRTDILKHVFHNETPFIGNYLNFKVQGLIPQLNNWLSDKVKVNAKIYQRQTNIFKETYTELIHLGNFCLNSKLAAIMFKGH